MNLNSLNVASTDQQAHNEQITEFVDDVALQTSIKPEPAALQPWYTLGEEDRQHSVRDVLARPTVLYNLTTTAGSANDDIQVFSLPYQLMTNNLNYQYKLAGYAFFRADTVIRVSVNAEPMSQGKLWLWFNPHGNVASVREVPNFLTCKYGYQGIEIDIATGAPVELHIPFCSQFSHYNLSTGSGNQGQVVLTKLTPVVGSVDITIHGWFENINLHMPTSLPIQIPPEAQVGKEGETKSAKGLVSGPMSVVADAADVLGKIPALSSVTDRVGWASRLLAGAAEYMGYSRPMNMQNPHPMKVDPMRGHTNLAGLDNSVCLGPNQDMELGFPSQVFGTDADEMDIRFVAGRLGYLDTFNWTTSQAAQTVLVRVPVTPSIWTQLNLSLPAVTTPVAWPAQDVVTYRGPHVAYVSNLFNYWRGSMKYRFAVAKTAFHSGRLRFSYFPTGTMPLPGAPYASADHEYTKILDLSVSSEISFEIPYVANRPWKYMEPRDYYTGQATLSTLQQEQNLNGFLQIDVLAPLKANANCSTTVQMLIFVAGGDDLSFMDLCQPLPAYGMKAGAVAQVFNQMDPQNTDPDQTVERRQTMFPKTVLPALVPEKLSMSGAITNLRPLTRRFYPTHHVPCTSNPVGNPTYEDYEVRLDPNYFGHWYQPVTNPLTDVTTVLSASVSPDAYLAGTDFGLPNFPDAVSWGFRSTVQNPIEYLSFIYRAFRGSRRYKAHRDAADQNIGLTPRSTSYFARSVIPIVGTPLMNQLVQYPAATTAGYSYPSSWALRPFAHESVSAASCEVNEVNVPYTNATPFALVADAVNIDGKLKSVGAAANHPQYRSVIRYAPWRQQRTNAVTNDSFSLYTSQGDDFSFGMLIGCPPVFRVVDGSNFV